MVNLAAPKTLEFIEFILEQKTFTQYRAKKELGLSMALVNQVTRYLLARNLITRQKSERKYVLRDAAGLITSISLFRNMLDIQLHEVGISLEKEEAMKLFSPDTVFCLDTALANYTNWWRSNRVCAYIDPINLDALRTRFAFSPGNNTLVRLFKASPPVKPVEIQGKKFTPQTRTIIDLVCDNQINTAEPLFKQLWGQDIAKP